jgi:ATP-dependent protease ClpP protease subunit
MYRYNNGPKKNAKKDPVINKLEEEEDDEGTSLGDNKDHQKICRENNHVYFHAEVNRGTIFDLIGHIRAAQESCMLMQFRYGVEEVPVYLHINSFGGSVFDAMTAIDTIIASKIPIYTIIEGATASAGTLMSVVGKKRFITPNAYMLIHQLSSSYWGKMNELEDEFKNLQSIMDRIKNIYKEHAKIPKKELSEILKHDLWWDSEKCIRFGLVDEIWTH